MKVLIAVAMLGLFSISANGCGCTPDGFLKCPDWVN
jgi:hypothetical protein